MGSQRPMQSLHSPDLVGLRWIAVIHSDQGLSAFNMAELCFSLLFHLSRGSDKELLNRSTNPERKHHAAPITDYMLRSFARGPDCQMVGLGGNLTRMCFLLNQRNSFDTLPSCIYTGLTGHNLARGKKKPFGTDRARSTCRSLLFAEHRNRSGSEQQGK